MTEGAAVLVTGATGLIGSALVARLRAMGRETIGASRRLGHDLADPGVVDRLPPASTVFHVAGKTFVPDSWTDPGAFYRANTLGTLHVLEHCRRTGARLVYVSAYIYGRPQRLPVAESHPAAPSNPYAHSKWLGEELCRVWNAQHRVPVVIVRPFNVYGPGQDDRFLVPRIVSQARAGEVVTVQDHDSRRDFVHVEDVADALLAAESLEFDATAYNVGSGRSWSAKDLVALAEEILSRPLALRAAGAPRRNELPDVIASCRLTAEGKWRPRVTLRDGIAGMLLADPVRDER